jgi:hypothetical protein
LVIIFSKSVAVWTGVWPIGDFRPDACTQNSALHEGGGDVMQPGAQINLYWLPLGAGPGASCVRFNGRVFEAIVARAKHRKPCDLYHSAVEVTLDGARFTIEMTPAWGTKQRERGVVATGPVGLRALGRSRLFRYEIRRWKDGVVPDLASAVASPVAIATDVERTRRLLEAVPEFPPATWGRDELQTGEMWNSNSLIAWLLSVSGHQTDDLKPPAAGRAPGWDAGLSVAARVALAAAT